VSALQAGRAVGQPARAAAERHGGVAGRGSEQEGGGHRERPPPRAQGCRIATSVGGVLTGRGADIIIIDDPLKPEEALSEGSGAS
jgi:hypothetical protein